MIIWSKAGILSKRSGIAATKRGLEKQKAAESSVVDAIKAKQAFRTSPSCVWNFETRAVAFPWFLWQKNKKRNSFKLCRSLEKRKKDRSPHRLAHLAAEVVSLSPWPNTSKPEKRQSDLLKTSQVRRFLLAVLACITFDQKSSQFFWVSIFLCLSISFYIFLLLVLIFDVTISNFILMCLLSLSLRRQLSGHKTQFKHAKVRPPKAPSSIAMRVSRGILKLFWW